MNPKRLFCVPMNRLWSGCVGLAVVGLPLAGAARAQSQTPSVVSEIRTEAGRSLNDPTGRPLPVGSHWVSNTRDSGYNGPGYQMGLIEQGHHLIPTLSMPRPGQGLSSEVQSRVQTYADWGIPISINGGNWHTQLKQDPWASLPDEQNPLLLQSDGNGGTKINHGKVDPLGPTQPWTQAGQHLIQDSPGFAQLQQLYPDPARVILLGNNETSRLSPDDANDSLRYTREYGTNTNDDVKRSTIGEGYAERFGDLLDGMKTSLSPDWQNAVKLVGYTGDVGTESFAPTSYGRFGGWVNYSTATYDGNIDRSHLPWDGASASYYTPDYTGARDYRIFSPQVQWMNVPFEMDQVLQDNPDFWLEQSVWDGAWGEASAYQDRGDKVDDYIADGQSYPPERYAGYAQYGMWLTRPRVVREFKGSAVHREDFPGRFEALLTDIDHVYQSDILKRFWRSSDLVGNGENPAYDENLLPGDSYPDVNRWFLLDASANPDDLHSVSTELKVYSLARVRGDEGDREWLLYAYAPLGEEDDVTITVPGFGDVVVDATRGGSFYHIDEATGAVTLVNPIPEPASLALLLAGAGGLMLTGRRRRAQPA